jgi:hypothetical protein
MPAESGNVVVLFWCDWNSVTGGVHNMVRARAWWRALRNIAIAVSVIFNIIFIVVLIVVVMLLFDLKRGLLQPIINGLDKSFYGLNEATILAQVKVNDVVPVKLNIPFSTNTVVKLTGPVPLRANASFNLPGGGGTINGAVSITLPTGLELPVSLNLNVPVDDKLPVSLNVPVDIRIKDTQLTVPVNELRRTLGPYVLLLNNLPNSWAEFWPFTFNIIGGKQVDLLAPNRQSQNPWPDFQIAVATPLPPGVQPTLPPNGTPPGFVAPTIDPAALATLNAQPSAPPPTNGSGGQPVPPANGTPMPASSITPAGGSSAVTATPLPPPGTPTPPPGQPPPQPTPTRAEDLGIQK